MSSTSFKTQNQKKIIIKGSEKLTCNKVDAVVIPSASFPSFFVLACGLSCA